MRSRKGPLGGDGEVVVGLSLGAANVRDPAAVDVEGRPHRRDIDEEQQPLADHRVAPFRLIAHMRQRQRPADRAEADLAGWASITPESRMPEASITPWAASHVWVPSCQGVLPEVVRFV